MSGPFKTGLIAGLIAAVVFTIINVAVGGRSVVALAGAALIAFAIVLLIAYLIARVVDRGRDDEDDYDYDYED